MGFAEWGVRIEAMRLVGKILNTVGNMSGGELVEVTEWWLVVVSGLGCCRGGNDGGCGSDSSCGCGDCICAPSEMEVIVIASVTRLTMFSMLYISNIIHRRITRYRQYPKVRLTTNRVV